MTLKRWQKPGIITLFVMIMLIIGLDQLSKYFASTHLVLGRPVEVLPVLNWTLLHNQGAAFSFLSNAGGWQRWLFTGISIGVSIVFTIWLLRLPVSSWLTRFSLVFIIAGAVGNLIDRLQMGYVVDFISVHWQQHFFPAFNVADMSITFGAFLMILDIYFHPNHHQEKRAA